MISHGAKLCSLDIALRTQLECFHGDSVIGVVTVTWILTSPRMYIHLEEQREISSLWVHKYYSFMESY